MTDINQREEFGENPDGVEDAKLDPVDEALGAGDDAVEGADPDLVAGDPAQRADSAKEDVDEQSGLETELTSADELSGDTA